MLTTRKRKSLLKLSTPFVVDAMDRLRLPECILDPAIRPFVPFTRMVGTAVTVRAKSERNPARANLDVYFEALETGQEMYSPIIVVEVPNAHHHQGIFGRSTAIMALRSGFVGALIDGAVRDTYDLRRMKFTVFSRTIAPGYICGKVEVVSCNKPVCIGGMTLVSGQIIFADNDGVVVIDPAHLDAVIEKAQTIQEWESRVQYLLTKGYRSKDAERKAGPMP